MCENNTCVCVIAANVGVPVSEMDDTYVKESATLSEAIIKYGTLDLYDPQRVQVINVSSQAEGHCLPLPTSCHSLTASLDAGRLELARPITPACCPVSDGSHLFLVMSWL